MPLPMSTAMLNWLTGTVLPSALFFEGTFASGTVRLWTGIGPIAWNGQSWQGIGSLLEVSLLADASTVEAKGIVATLSAFDAALLPAVLGEFVLGSAVTVYLAGFDDGVLIADPIPAFVGRMDQPTIAIDGQSASIALACENRLIDMDAAVDRRYTADDQQRDFPGDLGMNFVNSIQEDTVYWGSAPSGTNNL